MEASHLPKIVICNPRSVYNKSNQLKHFILEEEVDVMCLSETWERVEKPLSTVIDIDGYDITQQLLRIWYNIYSFLNLYPCA